MSRSVWIGFDPRPHEVTAFAVTRHSLKRNIPLNWPVLGLVLSELRAKGLYTRVHEVRHDGNQIDGFNARTYDVISGAPMATEFAISRFLVPHLARSGLALFMDCDMLVRAPLALLFDYAARNPKFAVFCVKHNHRPREVTKMDGQAQTVYQRKNWSSFMLFNVDHPANRALTIEMVNTLPGRDLHRFCWLNDEEIGELPAEWNFLVGHTDPKIEPKVAHFTDGVPCMPGYENAAYAGEWCDELARWAS